MIGILERDHLRQLFLEDVQKYHPRVKTMGDVRKLAVKDIRLALVANREAMVKKYHIDHIFFHKTLKDIYRMADIEVLFNGELKYGKE